MSYSASTVGRQKILPQSYTVFLPQTDASRFASRKTVHSAIKTLEISDPNPCVRVTVEFDFGYCTSAQTDDG